MTYHKIVISSPVPSLWRFCDFVADNGTNPIENWCNKEITEEARNMFNDILKDNSKTDDPINWLSSKKLKGKYKSLWEFRFVCNKRQHRVIGEFGPGIKQATLLVGCYHKDNIYTPANALDMAYKRSRNLHRKEGTRNVRKIRMDK